MPFPFGAVASLVGGVVNAGSALLANKRNNAANKQEAELAYRRAQEQVNRQNLYNSPAEQVARLRSAGLSPNLAYGAEGATVGNQDATPEYSPASYQSGIAPASAGASQMIDSLVGLREQKNRNMMAIADLAVKDSQSFANSMAGLLSGAEATEVMELLGYKKDLMRSEYEINENKLEVIGQEYLNLMESRHEIQSRWKLNEQQIQNLAADYHLSVAQAYAILEKLPHELASMDSQTVYNYVASEQGRAQIEYIARQTQSIGFYEGIESSKLDLSRKQFQFERDKYESDLEYKKAVFAAEAKMWQKDYRKDVMLNFMDNLGRVSGLAVGASVVRNGGSVQRLPSPIITPAGGSMFGQNWKQ